jgi:hypothetical protein
MEMTIIRTTNKLFTLSIFPPASLRFAAKHGERIHSDELPVDKSNVLTWWRYGRISYPDE